MIFRIQQADGGVRAPRVRHADRGVRAPGERQAGRGLRAPTGRRSKGGRAPGESGFTLVEVLVALSIFALAAVVLGSSYLNVLNSYEAVSRGVQTGEDFVFARQLVLNEPDREKVERGGEFDTASGQRARWTAVIESTNVADLFAVTFTCEIADPNRSEPDRVTQTFRLLRPTWSTKDPAERSKLREDAKTRILEMQGQKKQP